MADPHCLQNLANRFWSLVAIPVDPSACWLWQGSVAGRGYGQLRCHAFATSPERVYAHRLAWLLTRGDLPPGLFVCHHCDNPPCVRPDHLFLGTNADNMQDMTKKGRGFNVRAHRLPEHQVRGSRHGLAKLTDEKVREIRRRRALGATVRDLAAAFGVEDTAIRSIMMRRTWGHVDPETAPAVRSTAGHAGPFQTRT